MYHMEPRQNWAYDDPMTSMTSFDAQSEMRQLLHETCPERAAEIDFLIQKHAIRFRYDIDAPCMDFCVNKGGYIQVPVASGPLLVAHAYAYLLRYEAEAEASRTKPYPSQSANDTARRAETLLDWTGTFEIADPKDRQAMIDQCPADVLKPYSGNTDDTLTLAQHLASLATGAILLHEIGHLELDHDFGKRGSDRIPLENEADEWSRRFLLDRFQVYCTQEYPDRPEASALVKSKRLLGSIVGFLYLVRFEQINGVSAEHPRSFHRLTKCIGDYVDKPNDLAWGVATAILWFHLKRHDPSFITSGKYDNFRDCALSLLPHLAATAAQ